MIVPIKVNKLIAMKGFKDSVRVSTPELHKSDNLSHTINTSFDFYQFRPVFCQEMYPKDSYKVKVSDYFRADPLAGAVYGRYIKKYAAFFVPYRILWDKWNDYNTGGSSGRLEPAFPQSNLKAFADIAGEFFGTYLGDDSSMDDEYWHSAAIYRHMLDFWSDLGIPSSLFYGKDTMRLENELRSDIDNFPIPILTFAACRRIWYDWFRDQNLIGDDVEDTYCPKNIQDFQASIDPNDYNYFRPKLSTLFSPLPVPMEKDYFTTAFVEPQRGGAAFVPVSLPSPELNIGFSHFQSGSARVLAVESVDGSSERVGYSVANPINVTDSATDVIGMFDYNAVRVAKAMQRYLETHNVAGGADLQQLLADWGVAPNPAVFQRSTFIGSFTQDMSLTEVISPADVGDSQAGEVATRLNVGSNGSFQYTANEHGFFIIVMFARPENSYVPGISRDRMHGVLGNGRFDFFNDKFEKTGLQPSYAFEMTPDIFRVEAEQAGIDMFFGRGFVPRYAETKCSYNRFTGQLAFNYNNHLRVTRSFADMYQWSANDLFINNEFTMIYGYPASLKYDAIFQQTDTMTDHFQGWIHFDVDSLSTRNDYASPLIEDDKGNNISLPYAGVRM